MSGLTESQLRVAATIFAKKALRFGLSADEDDLAEALIAVLVDAELLLTDRVPFDVWLDAAQKEGWLPADLLVDANGEIIIGWPA